MGKTLVFVFFALASSATCSDDIDVKSVLVANDECSAQDISSQCHLGLLQSTAGKFLLARTQVQSEKGIDPNDFLAQVAAQLVSDLAHIDAAKQSTQEKCGDSPAAYVAAWAASQNYGDGMTCAEAKDKGICVLLSPICKATCGICESAEYTSGYSVGEVVSCSNHTDSVPGDALGVVSGFTQEQVKVKFPGGEYTMSPNELNKAECNDAPAADVARWAASQYYGEDVTCGKMKEQGICRLTANYCAATCGVCEDAKRLTSKDQTANSVHAVEQEKPDAAQLLARLAHMGNAKQGAQEKCGDSPAAYVAAWAASQNYGDGMTCAEAKDKGICVLLSPICKATCGICESAEYTSGYSVGEVVSCSNHTESVPGDALGVVSGFTQEQVKVKFPGGEYTMSPNELNKAECNDAPAADVARWAASQYYGEDVTCSKMKGQGICRLTANYCAATCGVCEDAKKLA